MRKEVVTCDKCERQILEDRSHGVIEFSTQDRLDATRLDLCASCYLDTLEPLREALARICRRDMLVSPLDLVTK